jgi:hypothetical protein
MNFSIDFYNRDSDADGIPDWQEIEVGPPLDRLDPTDARRRRYINGDTDGLTWKQAYEQGYLFSLKPPPQPYDTDGDSHTDDAEIASGTNPYDRFDPGSDPSARPPIVAYYQRVRVALGTSTTVTLSASSTRTSVITYSHDSAQGTPSGQAHVNGDQLGYTPGNTPGTDYVYFTAWESDPSILDSASDTAAIVFEVRPSNLEALDFAREASPGESVEVGSAFGGVEPYTFSVVPGNGPDHGTLGSNGLYSPSPPPHPLFIGTETFGARVTDATGTTQDFAVQITFREHQEPPAQASVSISAFSPGKRVPDVQSPGRFATTGVANGIGIQINDDNDEHPELALTADPQPKDNADSSIPLGADGKSLDDDLVMVVVSVHPEESSGAIQMIAPPGLRVFKEDGSVLNDGNGGEIPLNLEGKGTRLFVEALDSYVTDDLVAVWSPGGGGQTRVAKTKLFLVKMWWQPLEGQTNVEPNRMVTEIDGTGNPVDWEPMPGGGSRIFPDKTHQGDQTEHRNWCWLNINGKPNQLYYLKSFDVDDATPEAFDKDPDTGVPLVDPNGRAGGDNKGPAGVDLPGGRSGHFPPADGSSAITTRSVRLNTAGFQRVRFETTNRPGDNFRVALALTPDDFGDSPTKVHVNNPGGVGFIDGSSNQQPPGFAGVVSPMLTVWRKLYLEIDTMTGVPSPRPKPDDSIATGMSWTGSPDGTTWTLNVQWASGGHGTTVEDFYKGGTVALGSLQMNIIGSGPTSLLIQETPDETSKFMFIAPNLRVTDDDDKHLDKLGLPKPLPMDARNGDIVSGIMGKFAPAYIQVEVTNALGLNPKKTIPFENNAWPWTPFTNLDDAKDLTDQPDFWTHEVVFAYQPKESEDADPSEGEVAYGVTDSTLGFSLLFVEIIRERGIGNNPIIFTESQKEEVRADYKNLILGTLAHEIGHVPLGFPEESSHGEFGLMQKGAGDINKLDFTPKTIRRFRSGVSWGKY